MTDLQPIALAAQDAPNILFRYPHLIVLLIAYAGAEFSVAVLARGARAVGAVDKPGVAEYKIQKQAVPFLGGIGLFAGFIGAVLASLNWSAIGHDGVNAFLSSRDTQVAVATMIGGSVIAILGMVDDFKAIHALIKLGVLAAVTAVLMHFGVQVDLPVWDPLRFVVGLFWIVGIISAFNAIDNTDGVAGVTAASAAVWMFLVAWGTSAADAQPGQTYVCIGLLGATLGFLRHNRPPARVYLGNSGSFALGFFVAVLAMTGSWTTDPLRSAAVPVVLLSYPIFDLSYTVLMRWKQGIVKNLVQAVVVSGRDHTAHRLAALGYGPWRVLITIGAVNSLSGLAAYGIVRDGHNPLVFGGILAGVAAMYAVFGWHIRNAVDLHSSSAHISHRIPTGQLARLKAAADAPENRNTRKVKDAGNSGTARP